MVNQGIVQMKIWIYTIFLAALGAFAAFLPKSASAAMTTYTLTDVTFNDGATATGYFDFNPTTDTFGNFDIVTGNGVTDNQAGFQYTNSDASGHALYIWGAEFYQTVGLYNHSITLNTGLPISSAGDNPLGLGTLENDGYSGSGEFTSVNSGVAVRVITGGYLANGSPTPEASSAATFGILLLSAGLFFVYRKRQAA
jgi:hypothetical protein